MFFFLSVITAPSSKILILCIWKHLSNITLPYKAILLYCLYYLSGGPKISSYYILSFGLLSCLILYNLCYCMWNWGIFTRMHRIVNCFHPFQYPQIPVSHKFLFVLFLSVPFTLFLFGGQRICLSGFQAFWILSGTEILNRPNKHVKRGGFFHSNISSFFPFCLHSTVKKHFIHF